MRLFGHYGMRWFVIQCGAMLRYLSCVFLPVIIIAADVSGSWNVAGEDFAGRMELTATDTKVTGTLTGMKIEGTLENSVVKLTVVRADGRLFGLLEGKFTGDELQGTLEQRMAEVVGRRVGLASLGHR
jgi:hypothetical protein